MSIERELRGNWDNVYYPAPDPMVEEAMAPGQLPGDVLVAEAGGGGAAFGVYPGMGKRSQKSNIGEKIITGAPDFAAGTARGIATSAGGIGGDLQKIGRFAYALAADNQGGSFQDKLQRAGMTMEDPTFFPSSEDLSKTGYTIPGTNLTIPPFSPAVPPGTTAFGMTAEERQQAAELGQNVGELAGDPVMLVKGGQMAVKGAMAAGKALAPTAAEMAVKTMDKLGSPVMMNAVPPGPSAAGAATKAMAPASDIGFYSAVEKAALNVQRNSGSGQAFLNDITKGENVKLDEIKWMGLDDFLKGKKNVTKQEVQDFVQNNRVDVQEVQLGGNFKLITNPEEAIIYLANEKGLTPNQLINEYGYENANDYVTLANDVAQPKPSKFGKYTLPGGENYREILLTLPRSDDAVKAHSLAQSKALSNREKAGDLLNKPGYMPTAKDYEAYNLAEAEWNRLRDMPAPASNQYKSGHFDEKNVLAHMRVNDRVDADGKKMLLIEEVQSDWHQAGREKGYKGKGTLTELPNNYFVQELKTIDGDTIYVVRDKENPGVVLNRDYNKQSAINGVINELNATSAGGVPDAPFKDTWYQLALKRALRYAADNGYDRVGLTTGKQQVERYDLAKQVDEVIAKRNEDGTFNISATMIDGGGSEQSVGKNIPVDKLPDYVGKDLAKSIQVQEFGTDVYSGDQLKVGGEGMKKYYDDVYPKFLEKYGKKWGASVGQIEIGLPPKTSNSFAYFRDWFAENHSNVGTSASALSNWEQGSNNKYVKEFEKFRKTPTQQEPVRYIDITPEMRKSVQKGQPLAAVSSESTAA